MKVVINNYTWYLFDSFIYENSNKTGANIHLKYLTKQELNFIKTN